jgi:ATP-dependent Clp protease ATP-binding subunit ClpA
MFERYTDNFRRVIKIASGQAPRLEEVFDRDILQAIIKAQKSRAGRLLVPCSERVSMALAETSSSAPVNGQELVQHAVVESKRRGDNYIGTDHLLLAMLRLPESQSGSALTRAGIDLESFERSLRENRSNWEIIFGKWARKLGKTCRILFELTRRKSG